MKKVLLSLTLLFAITSFLVAQSPVGTWKTVDDETGEIKSHVEIYEKDGILYGKIVKILTGSEDKLCTACPGDKKNQPMLGLEIIWGLKKYKDYWSYGSIMDPQNGKVYKSNISLDGPDKLNLRGYIGMPAFGRTQTWERVK